MIEQYEVEKWIWTDADFDQTGWHDSPVYAISFLPDAFEIVLDLDYIFEWIHPEPTETYFKFWVAPATLVFENVYDIKMELSEPDFELDAVKRKDPQRPKNAEHLKRDTEWLWSLEAHRGGIEFRSVGYKQYVRKKPILGQAQKIEPQIRGGTSFYRGWVDE